MSQGGQIGIAVKEGNMSKGLSSHSALACVILWEGTQGLTGLLIFFFKRSLKSKLFSNIFQCNSISLKNVSKKTHRGAGFGLRVSSL